MALVVPAPVGAGVEGPAVQAATTAVRLRNAMMDRCGRVDVADHGTGRTRSHGGLESDKVMLFPYPRAMSRRTARAWVRGLRGGSQERPSQQSVVEGPDLDALAHTWDVLGEHDPTLGGLDPPGDSGWTLGRRGVLRWREPSRSTARWVWSRAKSAGTLPRARLWISVVASAASPRPSAAGSTGWMASTSLRR